MERQNNLGFSLVELMVTISIAAILLAIAAPSYQQFIGSTTITSASEDFVAALTFTRTEAIKRNVRVTMCKSVNGTSCTTGGNNWQQGWIIFKEFLLSGTPGTLDAGETILRVHGPLDNQVTLIASANLADFLSYLPNGQAAQSGQWDLCFRDRSVAGRDIILNVGTGRVNVVKDEPPVTCG